MPAGCRPVDRSQSINININIVAVYVVSSKFAVLLLRSVVMTERLDRVCPVPLHLPTTTTTTTCTLKNVVPTVCQRKYKGLRGVSCYLQGRNGTAAIHTRISAASVADAACYRCSSFITRRYMLDVSTPTQA